MELCWDGFAAPTPESEEWQPDPDSIPVCGGQPDPRFTKSPLTDNQRSILKREERLGIAVIGPTAGSRAIPTPAHTATAPITRSGIGAWPAQIPRKFVSTQTVASASTSDSIVTSSDAHDEIETLPSPQSMTAHLPEYTLTFRAAQVEKEPSSVGTLEMLTLQKPFQRSSVPSASLRTQESLCKEPRSKSQSIPPHLRKNGSPIKRMTTSTSPVSQPVAVVPEDRSRHSDGYKRSSENAKTTTSQLVRVSTRTLDSTWSNRSRILRYGRRSWTGSFQ